MKQDKTAPSQNTSTKERIIVNQKEKKNNVNSLDQTTDMEVHKGQSSYVPEV